MTITETPIVLKEFYDGRTWSGATVDPPRPGGVVVPAGGGYLGCVDLRDPVDLLNSGQL